MFYRVIFVLHTDSVYQFFPMMHHENINWENLINETLF